MADSIWVKYRKTIREFDAVLEHAKAVSSALVGVKPSHRHILYGEQIFVKQLGHCVTLRALAPDPTGRASGEFWDLASMSAIARCVVEAHDAFLYIAGGKVSVAERAFRLRLWELHDKSRRCKMFEAIGSRSREAENIRVQTATLVAMLQADPFLEGVQDLKRKLEKDPPPYHLSQKERCAAFGVNYDYYNAVTMELSQYVHTLPYSIHKLFNFEAGSSEALAKMSLPFQYVLPYLSRVTVEFRQLFHDRTPLPPSRTARTMALWTSVYGAGLKDA